MIISPFTREIKKNYEQITPYEFTLEEFWLFYLENLFDKNNIKISKSSKRVLAYICARHPKKTFFKGKLRKELLSDLELLTSNLTRVKTELVSLDLLEPVEDKKRGEYYLKGNIKRLQDYIYNKVQTGEDIFELLFKFKISTDD